MAKKSMTKKSRSTSGSKYQDLPSMEDTEYTDFNSGSNRRTRLASGRSQSVGAGERDYMSIVKEIVSHPTVKYVASGLATAMLTRLATKLSDKYPEISEFIRENLDQVGGKVASNRFNESGTARH